MRHAKRGNSSAFDLVRHANHRGLNNQFTAHQTAFNFRSSKAVSADIQHIINAAHDPKESVAVAARAIAR